MAIKPILKASTIATAFSRSKTETEMRDTLARYAKKNIGLFSFTEGTIKSSPAYAMLFSGHQDLLWSLIEEGGVDPVNPTNVYFNKIPVLLMASAADNATFIDQWAQKKLPLDGSYWLNAPLVTALMTNSGSAVIALSNAGADWAAQRTVKFNFGVDINKNPIRLSMDTTPWAMAFMQGGTNNVKLAAKGRGTFVQRDLDVEVPHQSFFFWSRTKENKVIKIGDFFNALLKDPENKEFRNIYSTTYWKTLSTSGFMDVFKESSYGKDVNWENLSQGKTSLKTVFKAVVKKEDKKLDVETQKIILDLFVGHGSTTDLQAYLSAERSRDFWDKNGLLGSQAFNSSIKHNSWSARNLIEKDKFIPLFPAISCRYIKSPAWWRPAAKDISYVNQFWDFFKKAATTVYADNNQSWSYRPSPLIDYLAPEYALSASNKTNQKAVYKQLEILSEIANKDKIKEVFKSIVDLKPKEANGKKVPSSYHLMSLAIPLNWAVENEYLSRKELHSALTASTGEMPTWGKSRFDPWVSKLERELLQEKVKEILPANKKNFDGAL